MTVYHGSIIEYLATRKNISRRKAMDVYYKSRLSEQVQAGQYGIENLDYKYLAEDLIDNEPELLRIEMPIVSSLCG